VKRYPHQAVVNTSRPARWAGAALIAALGVAAALGATTLFGAPNHQAPSSNRLHVTFGHSVDGRRLVAVRLGNPDAKRTALVVGQIHGDEPAGRGVVQALRRLDRPFSSVAIWTVLSVNPDGNRLDTRKNAHGVDLNRNFSVGWSGSAPPSSGYYAGPHPFSEPETRAVRRLARRIRPNISIWFHQPWDAVLACGHRHRLESRFAHIARMRTECRGNHLPGTAIDWEDKRLGGHAFVVEFHGGRLSASEIRHAAHATAHVAVKGAR
jgi:murein peptide amidase A